MDTIAGCILRRRFIGQTAPAIPTCLQLTALHHDLGMKISSRSRNENFADVFLWLPHQFCLQLWVSSAVLFWTPTNKTQIFVEISGNSDSPFNSGSGRDFYCPKTAFPKIAPIWGSSNLHSKAKFRADPDTIFVFDLYWTYQCYTPLTTALFCDLLWVGANRHQFMAAINGSQ